MDTGNDAERLAEQIGWVRRLAHGLVADPHLAEDLVQETWLAYLRVRPDTSRPLEPWFARVVANFAKRARRGSSRRAAREQDAAREEALPSSADVYERAALHRELVDAVLALEEPYRGTLLLRYVDELQPREIAKRQRVPVRTVNTRLRRGLAQLRRRLDAGHEHDRERWLGCLVAFAERTPTSISTLLLAGTLVLSMFLGGAALVILGGGRTDSTASHALAEPGSREAESGPPALADDTTGSARMPHTLTKTPARVWTGRVLDSAAAPVVGAVVELEAPPRARFARFDPPVDVAATIVDSASTDELGRFAVRTSAEGATTLRVTAKGFSATALPLAASSTNDPRAEVIVRLAHAATLRGHVLHADGGVAHAGLELLVRGADGANRVRTIDADGTWEIDGLPTGPVLVEALDHVCGLGARRTLVVDARAEAHVALTLSATARLRGHVSESGSRRPLADATVELAGVPHAIARTDRTGAFSLAAPHALGRVKLGVSCTGFVPTALTFEPLPSEGADIDVELVTGRTASGSVIDVDGTPLAGAWVAAVSDEWRDGEHRFDRVIGRTGADGSFTLVGLRRELAHSLLVAHPGRASVEREFPQDERAQEHVDLGSVRLVRGGTLLGRVVDEHATPRAHVELVLFRLGPLGTQRKDVPPSLFAAGRVFARTVTAADGGFVFADLPEGAWWVAAGADAARERVTREFELALDQRIALELVVPIDVAIAGRVLDAHGEPVGAAQLLATSTLAARDTRGGVSRDDGSFEIVGVTAGEHTLIVTPPAGLGLASARRSVRAPDSSVEIRLQGRRPLHGRVIDADGAPVAFARVTGTDELGLALDPVWCDRDGTFVLSVPEDRALELVAFASRETAPFQRTPDPEACARARLPVEQVQRGTCELRATR